LHHNFYKVVDHVILVYEPTRSAVKFVRHLVLANCRLLMILVQCTVLLSCHYCLLCICCFVCTYRQI